MDHVAQALQSVRETGYGLVSPKKLKKWRFQEPEIIGKMVGLASGFAQVRRACVLIRVNIQTEISPVVGTEQQSEEMIVISWTDCEQDPQKLWQSNLFGKPIFPTWSGKDWRIN